MVKIIKKVGITYDDVLLVPKLTHVKSRSEIDLSTSLTSKIKLTIPIISANMDTVTEHAMAIELARAGGIGIIHRFLSIEKQVQEVIKVKRFEHDWIENPYTVYENATLKDVFHIVCTFDVTSIPVINKKGELRGLITSRDILFINDETIPVKKIMTPVRKLITAQPTITLNEAKQIFSRYKIEKLPLIDKTNKLIGLMTVRDIRARISHPIATRDEKGRLRVGAAIGVSHDYIERTDELIRAGCDVIVIDIAHGHSMYEISALKTLKKKYPNIQIIAGNVATYEATRDLILAGADAIKVGIGPGALCTTRVIAGAGVPQITAIVNCVKAASKKHIPIIADGGIRTSGDIVKALASGASTIMAGSVLFAGCKESPALVFYKGNEKYKLTRGMASLTASHDRIQKDNDYNKDLQEYTAEGVEAIVPYKGSVSDILKQLVGGIQSGLSYSGALNIKQLWQKAEFIRITPNALIESHPHDVQLQ